jgi:hypothetical protein
MPLLSRIAKAGREIVPIPGSQMDLPKAKPMEEVGVSGLLRTKGVGYVYEEWLQQLSTHRQKQIFREMRDNDAVIGAMFFALEMILRKAEWRVEPAVSKEEEDDQKAQTTALQNLQQQHAQLQQAHGQLQQHAASQEQAIAHLTPPAEGQKPGEPPQPGQKPPFQKLDPNTPGGKPSNFPPPKPNGKPDPDAPLTQDAKPPNGADADAGAAPNGNGTDPLKAKPNAKAMAKKKANEESAQFVKECMEDMSHTWEDFVSEAVSMFAFGFALFETVYKRRNGPDGKKASRFNDGRIGWRKMAPRAQESILYWIWDDDGGLQGAVQLAAPDYRTVPIPIEKLLLFRTTSLKNNPEGRSVLRNCFRSWFFKRRIEEVEGIGIERDLCGIPVLYADADVLAAMGGEQVARNLVTNIRIDDQAGVILPLAYDDKGNPLVKLELMKTAGPKQTDPNASIQRYNSDMLNTIMAGFIQLGQSPTGSFSLHMSAAQIFAVAISAFMDSIAAVINRIAIPRLLAINQMDPETAPKLVPGEIGVRDLEELSNYVQKLSMAGLTFFDKPTTDYLRKVARLPETPDADDQAGPNTPPAPGQPPMPGQPASPMMGKPGKMTLPPVQPPGAAPPGGAGAGGAPPGAPPPGVAPSAPSGGPAKPPTKSWNTPQPPSKEQAEHALNAGKP